MASIKTGSVGEIGLIQSNQYKRHLHVLSIDEGTLFLTSSFFKQAAH